MARKSESEEEDGFTEVKWNFEDRVAGFSWFFISNSSTIYLL